MVDYTDLKLVLVWLSTAGAVSWMIWWSDFLRNLREPTDASRSPIEIKLSEWAKMLSPLGAQLVTYAGAALVPAVAAVIVSVAPPEVLDAIQPYYGFIASLFTGFIGMKVHFAAVKRPAVVG